MCGFFVVGVGGLLMCLFCYLWMGVGWGDG